MLDDTTTLTTIRNFISAESDISPVEKLLIIHLMTRKAEDHDIFDSQQHLARCLNVDTRTIMRSLAALEQRGWIARSKRLGKTSTIALCYEAIPSEEIVRLKITDDARSLAVRYQLALQKKCGRRKFSRNWLPQQIVSAQRILNEVEGDIELAAKIIGFAVFQSSHQAKARQSLYNLFGRWRKILDEYSASLEATEKAREAHEQGAA